MVQVFIFFDKYKERILIAGDPYVREEGKTKNPVSPNGSAAVFWNRLH